MSIFSSTRFMPWDTKVKHQPSKLINLEDCRDFYRLLTNLLQTTYNSLKSASVVRLQHLASHTTFSPSCTTPTKSSARTVQIRSRPSPIPACHWGMLTRYLLQTSCRLTCCTTVPRRSNKVPSQARNACRQIMYDTLLIRSLIGHGNLMVLTGQGNIP